MGKYVECQNCQEQYDCERTYLGGCTDGKEWEEKPLLSKSDKEFYFALMTNCKKVIEKCPNIEERRLACEYCRFEQVRKKAVEEYERKLSDGELVSKDWHDEQVLHAENVMEEQQEEIERLTADLISMDREQECYIAKIKDLNNQIDEFVKIARVSDTKKLVDGIKEQAVKDTAKEILLLSKDTPTYWDFVKAIKERYGVGVE